MENNNNIRSHVVLGAITLILAIILLVLVFVPRPGMLITGPDGGQYQTAPGSSSGGGQVSPSNSQGYAGASTAVGELAVPPIAF
jgi:hypothetical protein